MEEDIIDTQDNEETEESIQEDTEYSATLEEILQKLNELESLVQDQEVTTIVQETPYIEIDDNYKPIIVGSLGFILAALCVFCLFNGIKR